MSFRNKGSMAATVTVSLEPDRSGNFVCDGTADDVQIQAAIDYVGALGGGMVYIKRGLYDISATITINERDIIIEGCRYDTELLLANGVNTSMFELGNNANDFTMIRIRLRGNQDNQTAGHGINCNITDTVYNGVLRDVIIDHFKENGVNVVDGQSLFAWIFDGCYIENNYGDAFHGEISGSCFKSGYYYSNDVGINLLDGSNGNMIIGDSIHVNTTQIKISRGWHNVITGNSFEESGEYSIHLYGSRYNIVTDNFILNPSTDTDNTYSGIYLDYINDTYKATRNIIANNIIISSAVNKMDYGIEDEDWNSNQILDNRIVDAQTSGVKANHYSDIVKNRGFNSVGVIANPFIGIDITLVGNTATPVANTDYTVRNTDIKISSTDSGNTDCAIMLKDPSGNNILQAALSTIEEMYIPIDYQINWGAFTGAAPTVTISFN